MLDKRNLTTSIPPSGYALGDTGLKIAPLAANSFGQIVSLNVSNRLKIIKLKS